jgi:hypothetical protein
MNALAQKPTSPTAAAEVGMVFVKCGSHRARNRLIGRSATAQGFYSLERPCRFGIYAVCTEALHEALGITGVTRFRGDPAQLGACYSI